MKKAGSQEKNSLEIRLKTRWSVVQVLSTKLNIFKIATRKNPETVVVSGFSVQYLFCYTRWV